MSANLMHRSTEFNPQRKSIINTGGKTDAGKMSSEKLKISRVSLVQSGCTGADAIPGRSQIIIDQNKLSNAPTNNLKDVTHVVASNYAHFQEKTESSKYRMPGGSGTIQYRSDGLLITVRTPQTHYERDTSTIAATMTPLRTQLKRLNSMVAQMQGPGCSI